MWNGLKIVTDCPWKSCFRAGDVFSGPLLGTGGAFRWFNRVFCMAVIFKRWQQFQRKGRHLDEHPRVKVATVKEWGGKNWDGLWLSGEGLNWYDRESGGRNKSSILRNDNNQKERKEGHQTEKEREREGQKESEKQGRKKSRTEEEATGGVQVFQVVYQSLVKGHSSAVRTSRC